MSDLFHLGPGVSDNLRPPQRLDPAECQSTKDWQRWDLRFRGVPYPMAVFVPRDFPISGQQFEKFQERNWRILSSSLDPDSLKKLLRPGGSDPDLSFYIGHSSGDSLKRLKDCGFKIENLSGEYRGQFHQIYLRYYTQMSQTFFHEMGHAIYKILLTPQARNTVRALYRRLESGARTTEEGWREFPNSQGRVSNEELHSRKDEGEFFADLVEDFFENKYRGTVPQNPRERIRYYLMEGLFQGGTIRPENVNQDKVEALYRWEKDGFSLDRNGWVLFPELGVQNGTLPYQGKRIRSDEAFGGFGGGYLFRPGVQGLFGGLGLSGDASLYKNPLSPAGEKELPVKNYDAGVWGFLGYTLGKMDVNLIPFLGARYQVIDGAGQDHFLWGGELEVSEDHRLGFSFRYREAYRGERNFGGAFRVYFPDVLNIFP